MKIRLFGCLTGTLYPSCSDEYSVMMDKLTEIGECCVVLKDDKMLQPSLEKARNEFADDYCKNNCGTYGFCLEKMKGVKPT